MKRVISAFPGTGKSTIFNNAEKYGLKQCFVHYNEHDMEYQLTVPAGPGIPVFDSDSSVFDKSDFPANYIRHIKEVLARFDDVVIFVSSHEEVRDALREAGIEYILAYPQRELKEEYITRYTTRGSTAGFIGLLGRSWNTFIDSTETDPTETKVVLGEGQNLADVIKDQLPTTPEDTTNTIVDVLGDQPVTVQQPEPINTPEPTVLNTPEGIEEATVDAEVVQGTTPDIIPDTIAEPVPDEGTVAEDRDAMVDPDFVEATQQTEPGRAELIEAKFDMQNDIETLETVISSYNDAGGDGGDFGGMEKFADGSELLTAAAADIKTRYEVEVEPTISGMEGFLDGLKKVFVKFKGKTDPQLQTVIKDINDIEKALSNFKVDPAKLKEGEVTVATPAGFDGNYNLDKIESHVKTLLQNGSKLFDAYHKNAKNRLHAGLKVYNKYAKHQPVSETEAEKLIGKDFPIKPERLEKPFTDMLDNFDPKVSGVKLHVLSEAGMKKAISILELIMNDWKVKTKQYDELDKDALDHSEMAASPFWDAAWDLDEVDQLSEAIYFQSVMRNLDEVQWDLSDALIPVAKFLEEWITKSVK